MKQTGLIFLLIFNFICAVSAQKNKNGVVSDIDGNTYHTVKIGAQIWMTENLSTTKLNNGTEIHLVTDSKMWQETNLPSYCWYGNDQAKYGKPNGALYNWYTVNTGKLCPLGFHVPNDAEWETLVDYLGGSHIAGAKMKIAHDSLWNSHSTNGNVKPVGFNAFPSGYRNMNGPFGYMGGNCFWWSTTLGKLEEHAWDRNLYGYSAGVYRYASQFSFGFSVRCLKDE